ncbi:hypothetical protein CRYUN_Cryun12cG0007400 [Craigia yunnanensis]
MSSSKPKDGSPPQDHPSEPIPILYITGRLDALLIKLSKAKSIVPQVQEDGKKDVDNSRTDADDESKKGGEMDMYNQLDKACKELNYMISAFKKLEDFEADISEPLKTLEDNVNDIVTDLGQPSAVSVKQLIERNLKVLRSNITKVKIQIPLQHQVSGTVSKARGYLQTTVASKEVGYLPNPYEAKEIFKSGSFVKEFRDHYEALDNRQKLCLLCFAIFPENAEVKKRLLRFWWVGERLKPVPASDTDTVEKGFVNKSLRKFEEMGFIEPVTKKSRSQATSYKMHPIIRSFIIKLAKEANFFDYDSKGNPTMDISASKKSCLVKSKGTSSWFSKHVSQPDPKQQPKSLDNQQKENKQGQKEKEQPKSLDNQHKEKKQGQEEEEQQQKNLDNQQKKKKQRQDEKERIRQEEQKLKNLDEMQTLFNVSKQFPDLPMELFSKMRNICVLYLGKWESTAERHMEVENSEFLTGLKNMKKLRFFSLQGISGISKLTVSLCKLTNLRILDLRACHNLEELPRGIGSLKQLTDLDLSECYLLDNMPKQLSQLSKLKVLKGFVISKNSSCTLENLAALHKLEKLSINVNSDEFSIIEEGCVFFKFMALQKLKIAWGAGGEGAAKPTNGNKVNNGTKSTRKDNGEKKGNGNQESSADKSKDQKKQESDTTAKSGATMAHWKLKIPWGACREGSSKSIVEIKGTAAAEKSGEAVKTQDENRDAKKQGSDAAKPGPTKSVYKKDEKTQESSLKLVKLDLQCFPKREPPSWLVPKNLTRLRRLYIRGGELSNLGESSMPANKEKWEVETLRLKFLTDFKTNWKELQTQFPKLKYLEKVKCPQITFCPCDANGVWMLKQPGKIGVEIFKNMPDMAIS